MERMTFIYHCMLCIYALVLGILSLCAGDTCEISLFSDLFILFARSSFVVFFVLVSFLMMAMI